MDFLAERERLLTGDALECRQVIVQAFAWPPPASRGVLGLLISGLVRLWRNRRPDTVALYPPDSTKWAYPFGIVPLEVPREAPLPSKACAADAYGLLDEGHAVALQIAGELYFPTGPFAPAPMWAPRLRSCP